MKDTIIKETGNSRFLRSSVAEDITFAEFIAMLRAGQLPIDLAGINEEGIETLGTALGKGTLLDEETEISIWGDFADRTPTNALKAIFETLSSEISEKAKIVTGTYTGNATARDSYASRTISLGFTPRAVFIFQASGRYPSSAGYDAMVVTGQPVRNGYGAWAEIVNDGFKVGYYHDSSDLALYIPMNVKGTVYNYIAIA